MTRYAFLSDFGPGDGNPEAVQWLRDLHFNAIQFYDWMYRHDALLPPADRFPGPSGPGNRIWSVIREKIGRLQNQRYPPHCLRGHLCRRQRAVPGPPGMGDVHPGRPAHDLRRMAVLHEHRPELRLVGPHSGGIPQGHCLRLFRHSHGHLRLPPKQVWDNQHRPVDLAEGNPNAH